MVNSKSSPMSNADTNSLSGIILAARILTAVRVAALVVLGALALLTACVAYVYTSGNALSLPQFVRVDQLAPWPLTIYQLLAAAALFGAIVLVINQLRDMVASLTRGDPFVPENAGRLRIIWIAIAGYEIARLALGLIIAAIAAISRSPSDGLAQEAFDIRLTPWFSVLVIFVLAEVFRHGARLREEQKLTI